MKKYKVGDVVKANRGFMWNKEKTPYLKLLVERVDNGYYVCKILNYDDVKDDFNEVSNWYFSFDDIDGYWEENEMVEVKNLDLVELENGTYHVATQNGDIMGFIRYGEWWNSKDEVDRSAIVAIYRPLIRDGYNNSFLLFQGMDECFNGFDLVYEREETKEMTVKEIEEALGVKNLKIVK